MKAPQVVVCAGGGGVGKTTASAALAFAWARRGKRTLLVSVDPARRLADALGVELGTEPRPVKVSGGTAPLDALMPEPQSAVRAFVELAWRDEPESLRRLLDNRVYLALEDSIAGAHDLVSSYVLADVVQRGRYDVVVLDTAPSRHALDFLTWPERLGALMEGRAIRFLAALAPAKRKGEKRGVGRGLIEGAIGRVLGADLLLHVTALFGELLIVRERLAQLSHDTAELLTGPGARYVLVTAPSGAAEADARFLATRLVRMERRAASVLLNRALVPEPAFVALATAKAASHALRGVIHLLAEESGARQRAADALDVALKKDVPGAARIRLPLVEDTEPTHVVEVLSRALDAELSRVLGGR